MPKYPAYCEQLPLLQGVECVRVIREDDHSAMLEIRGADRSQAALKWIHLPAGNSPGAQRMLHSRTVEELSILRAFSSAPAFAQIQDTAVQRGPDGSLDVFIRTEWLAPLADRIQNSSFSTDDAARLISDAAEALSLCHTAGVVHGNLKPANILYGSGHYKLSDGSAALRQLRQNPQAAFFQSPEQRAGNPATPQWDVYGLGMTLYVLYHEGMLPFQTKPGPKAMQAAWERFRSLDAHAVIPAPRNAPAAIASVILRAIALAPDKRYQSPDELASEFAIAVSSLSHQARQTPLHIADTALLGSTVKPVAKSSHLPGLLIALTAILALLAVIILPKFFTPDAPPPLQTAIPLLLSAEPEMFSATLTLSNCPTDIECTALVQASGATRGWEANVVNGAITLPELAPQTTYTVTVIAGSQTAETTLTTLSPVQKRLKPAFTSLYTTTYVSLLRNLGVSKFVSEYWNRLSLVPQNTLALQDLPVSSQDLALLLYWRADLLETPPKGSSPCSLVLRAHNDAFVLTESTPLSEASCTHDVTLLLDACFERYGHHDFSEPVQLEIYWLDELVCTTQLTLVQAP